MDKAKRPFGYDARARKRAINLSINEDLIDKARTLGVNVSGIVEERLAEEVIRRQRATAEREAKLASAAWNEYHSQHGSPADEFLDV